MVDPLTSPDIVAEFARAWRDSEADHPAKRHEEGGYVIVNPDQSYGVERWIRGEKSRISPPPLDSNGCYNGKVVVAAFHVHPNPPVDELGREWEQGPSASDRRWHARRKLRGFVISRDSVFEIREDSTVHVVGTRDEVLRS